MNGGSAPSVRPAPDCGPGLTMNFYLAGLRPGSVYSVQHVILAHDSKDRTRLQYGPALMLTTPNVTPIMLPKLALKIPPPAPGGILLHSALYTLSYATDLSGSLVWYSATNAGLRVRLSANSTTSASLDLQRRTPMLGASWGLRWWRSSASR